MPLVSVIIPCFNSEYTIQKVVKLTIQQLVKMGYCYQIILVNDGSHDQTFFKVKELCDKDAHVQGCDLARNFGQQNAIMAGLNFADGDFIMGMDDDMQTHPSQIPKLINKLLEGHDVVYGKYPQKKCSPFRKFSSWLNDVSLRVLIGKPKDFRASSFWACKRFVRDEIIKYTYPFTHLQGLFLRITNDIVNVEIQHFEREHGKSNYTFRRLIRLWSGCTNFSILPLRIFIGLGLISAFAGFVSAIFIIINKILTPSMAAGWPSVICTILIFSGLILCGLGLVGEYIGRIFMCINVSPQFVIRNHLNEKKLTTKQDEQEGC